MGIRSSISWAMAVVLLGGCASSPMVRPQAPRDPMVMSNLTHDKEDVMFASTENEREMESSGGLMHAASISKKSNYSPESPGLAPAAVTVESALLGSSTVEGRLTYRERPSQGWFIQNEDRVTGESSGARFRLLDAPHLAMFRDGDWVRVHGDAERDAEGQDILRVQGIHLTDSRSR